MDRRTYWRRQLTRILVLLSIWAFVAFGLSILLVEPLNRISIGGMPFGFWMAQQGSIYIFVILILVFALMSGKAEREAGLSETEGSTATMGEGH